MSVDVVVPVVHMNGTPQEQLVEQLEGAYSAISAAVRALRRAAPNGRDYYPVPGLLDRAMDQHDRRMRVLTDLQDEIQREVEAIEERA